MDFYKHYKLKRNESYYSTIEFCCDDYAPYKAEQSKDFVCLPKCEGCNNGFCESPGECVCYDGFVKNDDGKCVFTCPVSCLNGKCNLDGTCICNVGFKLSENRDFCRPICSMKCGTNQNCSAPETCSCSKGYTLASEGCIPVCNPLCAVGGRCTDSNVCTCNRDRFPKNGVCQANCYQ